MFASLLRKPKEKAAHADAAQKASTVDNGNNNNNQEDSMTIINEPNAEPETPVLNPEDEQFLERLTGEEANEGEEKGLRPPLPPRTKIPDLSWDWDSDTESFQRSAAASGDENDNDNDNEVKEHDGSQEKKKGKEKETTKKPNRLSLSFLRHDRAKAQTRVQKHAHSHSHTPSHAPLNEAEREQADLQRVLDDLDLAASSSSSRSGNPIALAASRESAALGRAFTQVLRDLAAGVPTAAGDLTALLDRGDDVLRRSFSRLPGSLRKLVARLPDKLSAQLAPEVLAAAAEVQGLSTGKGGKGGVVGVGKRVLAAKDLVQLATKPGALAGMLRAIVNALKTRWPAFIGTNALWSVALFLLLFVLWYCHKRGKEVRLEREKTDAEAAADAAGKENAAGPVVVEGEEAGVTTGEGGNAARYA